MGVRSTLLLLVVLIAAPFLLLAIVNAQRNLQAEHAVAQERALTRARLLSARMDDLVGSVDALLLAMSETLSTDPDDIAENDAKLASIGVRLPAVFSQLRISAADGAPLGHSTGSSPDVSGRKYFRDALVQPGLSVGEAAPSLRNGAWTVGFARAIHDATGKVKAVVSITLRLEHLREILDARSLPAGSMLFLVSERGVLLAAMEGEEDKIGADASGWPTVKRALEVGEGSAQVRARSGEERLIGIARSGKLPWTAVVGVPTGSAYAAVRAEERRMLLLFLAALGFAVVAGLLAARRLTTPIRRITADALAFGGGDLSRRCTVAAPAEMGVLARTFNRLADDVAARTALIASSEALYRAMFESNPQPMWVFDRESLRFLAVNNAAQVHYGYSRAEFLAMKVTDVRPAEEEKRLRAYLAEHGSGIRSAGHWRHRRKDGTMIDVQISTHDLLFEGRRALHSVIVDVTDRLRVEREIRQLNLELEERVRGRTAELQASNRELEAFTYSVSHDLHNPLRTIDGFSKLLLDHPGAVLDAQARNYLERIRGSAQRMGALINALLNLSRVSRGTLRKTHIDLSGLAAQIAEELQQQAPERQVAWRIAPGLAAQGDAGLLRAVLDNLLGNAWKYSRKQAHPVIEFGRVDGVDGQPEYYVRDNGAGFDMAYAGKLFSVFQRLHAPQDFEGNGIGLATVARIIERHGGTVRGEGQAGAGATFYFTLPGGTQAG